MFKLEDSSIPRHAGERCVRTFDNDAHKKYELDVESVENEDVKEIADNVQDQSDSSDSDNGQNCFPDTHIKIGALSTQASTETAIERLSISESTTTFDVDAEDGTVIHAAPQQMPRKNRVLQKTKGKQSDSKKKQQLQKQDNKVERSTESTNEKQKSGSALKRGQKSKLKKIKEKYKDQDEEEKLMRMEILKSAGNKKPEPPKVTEKDEAVKSQRNQFQANKKPQQEQPLEEQNEKSTNRKDAAELDAVDEDETQADGNDTDMLNSLTGLPVEEDEILFALPVVAPYNALNNYK